MQLKKELKKYNASLETFQDGKKRDKSLETLKSEKQTIEEEVKHANWS